MAIENYETVHWIFLLGTTFLWGSWINTLKLVKGLRFETYYIDFVVGMLLSAIFMALFLFFLSVENIPFLMKDAWHREFILVTRAFLAGVLFNIAICLLVASTAFSGMAFTLMAVFGTGLIADQGIYSYFTTGDSTSIFLLSAACISTAIFWMFSLQKLLRFSVAKRTLFLSCLAGVFVGLFYPLFDRALDPVDIQKLSPNVASSFLCIGMVFCHLFFGPFLMKNPLFGHSLLFSSSLSIPLRHHDLGMLGGMLWFLGLGLKLHAEATPHEIGIFFAVQLAPLLSFLYGIFLWKEVPKELKRSSSLWGIFCLYFIGICFMGYYRYGV